jgi:hypothetical protein
MSSSGRRLVVIRNDSTETDFALDRRAAVLEKQMAEKRKRERIGSTPSRRNIIEPEEKEEK